jgi:hypothetical protein
MGKLGKTLKAEHQQTPRKTAYKMARELCVNVRRGLIQTNNRTES